MSNGKMADGEAMGNLAQALLSRVAADKNVRAASRSEAPGNAAVEGVIRHALESVVGYSQWHIYAQIRAEMVAHREGQKWSDVPSGQTGSVGHPPEQLI